MAAGMGERPMFDAQHRAGRYQPRHAAVSRQRRGWWRATSAASAVATLVASLVIVVAAPQVLQPAAAATIDATFDDQGPSPITGGQTENVTPNNEVAGATHTVVAHPGDANTLWVGSTNGGVWRTTNATAASPHWVPLTDQAAGLSIGALALDPTVATNTVLVAGIGQYSSFFGTGEPNTVGGPLVGILRTTNGGGTWTNFSNGLTGESLSGVAPRGNTIVVSSSGNTQYGSPGLGGIFRSTDGGATFVRLSNNGTSGLPNGGVFDLVSDPSNNARLYAGVQTGIFRSDDTGATWTNVTNQVTGISAANTNNIELAVHNAGANNVVYAGVINNGQLNGLWRSANQGANWAQLDTPTTNEGDQGVIGLQPGFKPGTQGGTHFSIVADPTNANFVYVGGDRQPIGNGGAWPNSIGARNFTGRLFRCNAGAAAGAQCTPITHNGTSNNSAPHADSREMTFDVNGDLVETDDGGIYRQTDPSTAAGVWQSLNGDIQVSDHHSCDYDHVGNIIICGDQDSGSAEQTAAGSSTWTELSQGDGGFVAVNDAGAASVRFSASNRLGAAGFLRRTCTAANVCVNSAPGFNVVGQGQTIQNFETLPIYTPMVMNKIDGTRLIVSSNTRVYESTDSLDNLTIIATPGVPTTRAIAYGGRQSGADNAGVLWYGDRSNRLWLRAGNAGAPAQVAGWTNANGLPYKIVLDPQDWATAYVTNQTQIFRTTDAGLTFTDVTGNLTSESPNARIVSLEVLPIAGSGHYGLLAGTDTGVFATQTQNLGTWAQVGNNLPNTLAQELRYDATDDVLLVGTLGRGSWLLQDASELIPTSDVRVTKTDSPDPVKAGEELFYTVTVTNDGPGEAVGVLVVDDLPDEVIFLEDSDDCTYDPSQHRLTCPVGDLESGESKAFTIKTLVKSDTVVNEDDGTLLIRNTVTAGSASLDSNTSNNSATTPTFVQDKADLKVTKVCKPDDELPAGETGTCTVYVDNLGPSSARNVELRDANLSDGAFTFGTITASQGTCAPPVDGVVVCDLGDLPAASTTQSGRATVTVDVSANEDVDINDVATVKSPTPDPNTSNNQAQGSISVMAVADLAIEKTGATSVIAGQNVTYTINVQNNGPSKAQGVVVKDDLSPGVQILSVSGSNGAGCNAGTPGNPSLPTTCSFGTLLSGATRTMTIVVKVLPGFRGPLLNDTRVSSSTFDDDLSNNLDTVDTNVTGQADLSITKSDSPDPVTAGQLLTYTIVVTNGGPSTAEDVVITDTLPPYTTYVSGVNGNGTGVCALVQQGVVVCQLGDMDPGHSETVYLTVQVSPATPPGTVLTNKATVSSSTTDPNNANNTATATTTVNRSAELWLDKQAVNRSGNPAPMVVYTLVVHNNAGCETDAQSTPTPNCGSGGPSDSGPITVTDKLPLDAKKFVVQYLSPQCTYNKTAHTVTCTSANVPAGATVSFVIEAQISGSVGTITNTATLTAASDPVTSNNTNSATLVMKGGTGKK